MLTTLSSHAALAAPAMMHGGGYGGPGWWFLIFPLFWLVVIGCSSSWARAGGAAPTNGTSTRAPNPCCGNAMPAARSTRPNTAPAWRCCGPGRSNRAAAYPLPAAALAVTCAAGPPEPVTPAPAFASTRDTCVFTVASEMPSRRPMEWLLSPSPRAPNTSRSRSVRSSSPAGRRILRAGPLPADSAAATIRAVTSGAMTWSPSWTRRTASVMASGFGALEQEPRSAGPQRAKQLGIVVKGGQHQHFGRAPPGMMPVASTPSMTGMRKSMSTTSGRSVRAMATAVAPSPASPTTSMSGGGVHHHAHAEPDGCVVVGQQHGDGLRGRGWGMGAHALRPSVGSGCCACGVPCGGVGAHNGSRSTTFQRPFQGPAASCLRRRVRHGNACWECLFPCRRGPSVSLG